MTKKKNYINVCKIERDGYAIYFFLNRYAIRVVLNSRNSDGTKQRKNNNETNVLSLPAGRSPRLRLRHFLQYRSSVYQRRGNVSIL